MRVHLRWLKDGTADPSTSGRAYLGDGESLTVGRETGVDIQLKDDTVSRLHAEVYVDGDAVIIKDAGSKNGISLDGKQVVQARWEPGQSVQIGPYRFSLVAVASAVERSRPAVPAPIDRPIEVGPRSAPPQPGRIELGDVYRRAKKSDSDAVRELFLGFLGRNETVVDAGHLGSLGLIFPEHSFWCITNARICGMVVNASGRLDFSFCFLKAVDVAHFHQPSRVGLWVSIGFYLLSVATLALAFVAVGLGLGTLGKVVSFIAGLLVIAGGIYLVPWVTRLYYRFTKSGCAFFTKEHVYLPILADRNNLKAAQFMLRLFEEQKRRLGV
jgi:Inner membrane component of T3SS, cytoplasmic domain